MMATPIACWQSRKRQHSPELLSPQPQHRPFSPSSWTLPVQHAPQTHKRGLESPEETSPDGKRRKVDLRLGFEGMSLNRDGRPVSSPMTAQKHESPTSDTHPLDFEEVSGWQPNAQQGRVEEPAEVHPDGINVEEIAEDDIYEIPRREHDLYELENEKWHYIDDDPDHIHISSLSDSSSSPPSSNSRDSTPQPSSLEQPGSNGFTISPSFLTSLLRANANAAANVPLTPYHWDPEREKKLGMVLYRQPHGNFDSSMGSDGIEMDSGRIEEIHDDSMLELDAPMDVDMADEMEIG